MADVSVRNSDPAIEFSKIVFGQPSEIVWRSVHAQCRGCNHLLLYRHYPSATLTFLVRPDVDCLLCHQASSNALPIIAGHRESFASH
jgi:hypothetical protein